MLYRRPLPSSLSRGARQVIELLVMAGAAVLLSYLVLQMRW